MPDFDDFMVRVTYEDGYLKTAPEGGGSGTFSCTLSLILVRWMSKVAENEAMIGPDLKNIFSKKNLIGKIFFEADTFYFASILEDFNGFTM